MSTRGTGTLQKIIADIDEDMPLWERKNKDQKANNKKAMRRLCCVTLITLGFMCIEITGAIWAHSIALLSDSAHLLSDVLGIGVSIWALCLTEKRATEKYSFGYHRAEVLGTIVSLLTIWLMTIYLVVHAIERLVNPPKDLVVGETMLITACCSLVFNMIQASILNCADDGDEGDPPGELVEESDEEEEDVEKKEDLERSTLLTNSELKLTDSQINMRNGLNKSSLDSNRLELSGSLRQSQNRLLADEKDGEKEITVESTRETQPE